MKQHSRQFAIAIVALAVASLAAASWAATCGCGHTSCTGAGPCPQCVPACKSSWEEKKVKTPKYSVKCDYMCERAHESWHTGPTECRCRPPCGEVFIKKKVFKTEEEKVEKVPKYEVKMVPAPCQHCSKQPCCCPGWHAICNAAARLFGF